MKNKVARSTFLLLVVVAIIADMGVFMLANINHPMHAYAAPVPPPQSQKPPTEIKNVHANGKEYHWIGSVDIPPHAGGSLTRSSSISNSWTATGGVTAGPLSASLGFSVTQTYTVTPSCTYPGGDQPVTLAAEAVYIDWYYDVYQGTDKLGTGVATQYDNEVNCVVLLNN